MIQDADAGVPQAVDKRGPNLHFNITVIPPDGKLKMKYHVYDNAHSKCIADKTGIEYSAIKGWTPKYSRAYTPQNPDTSKKNGSH
jgi:hypothetical protein